MIIFLNKSVMQKLSVMMTFDICASTITNGFWTILSTHFHSKGLDQPVCYFNCFQELPKCAACWDQLPKLITSESHLPDQSSMERFELGFYGHKVKLLTIQPCTHIYKNESNKISDNFREIYETKEICVISSHTQTNEKNFYFFIPQHYFCNLCNVSHLLMIQVLKLVKCWWSSLCMFILKHQNWQLVIIHF